MQMVPLHLIKFSISAVGVPTYGSEFGTYRGLILLQNIVCVSRDTYDCSGSITTDPACTTDRVAGVMCTSGGDGSSSIPTVGTGDSGSVAMASSFLVVVGTSLLFYFL